MKKRILSILLICCMVLTMLPATALAEESGQTGGVTASGLCEHHPAHDDECGYTEGTAGTPCSHEHTDDCYTEVTDCVHEHTEDCYPQNSVSGNNATSSNADEPTECTHVCSEESGCITKQLNCQHEHDEDCGYTPATVGTPCGYVCEICGAENNSAEAMTVERVQAMIDALPDAEEITEDNAEEVTAQLEAIDEAKAELTDEEIDELDITRYMAAAAALGSLAAPMLLANAAPAEQFNLTPGGTYWFDLSGENIPGTVNTGNRYGAVSVPDATLHYVPFTYAGTVDAYVLNSSSSGQTGAAEAASQTTDESGQYGYTYPHSLFVADYAVTHTVNWNELNTAGLIFGKSYTGGSVDYTLRAPSGGSWNTVSGDSERGIPQSNEWDAVLDRNSGYIKNWKGMLSWGQDSDSEFGGNRVVRGKYMARFWSLFNTSDRYEDYGFRPVLEVLHTDTLSPDGLKAVTLDLNGGKLGGSTDTIQIIVKNGAAFTAPTSAGLTRPNGDTGSFFIWKGSNGNLYTPGDSVPADVTTLTALWTDTYTVTLNTNGGTIANGKDVTEYTYGTGATLPTADDITRDSHTFEGWYEDENFSGSPVTGISATDTGKKEFYAKWKIIEQFNLTPGGMYWFDLSGENIPGTVNTGNSAGAASVPDTTLHYVPFTYAGTVDAYKLTSEIATTEDYAEQNKYPHSLFVADYAVTHTVSWSELSAAGLIFGRSYTGGSVDYTLRALSMGSWGTGSGDSERGTPQSNEWDAVLDKNIDYIKIWNGMYSWGQDAVGDLSSGLLWRAARGDSSAPRCWSHGHYAIMQTPGYGFRPVLDVLNADTLSSDGLKAVTLDLNGGKLGGSTDNIQILVKNGAAFTAPASDGLNAPTGYNATGFKWQDSDGNLYAPGDSVPADVTTLTAQWSLAEQFNLTPGGTYWFDLSGENIPGTVNTGTSYGAVSVPDATLHYVPFTYAGTVDAYVLNSSSSGQTGAAEAASQTTDESGQYGYTYPHSLFVADYAMTRTVNWNELNTAGLIFGKSYIGGSVDYTLRAPSVGSWYTGSGYSGSGTPQSNEWDTVLDKNSGYIKNWNGMLSWGQETVSGYSSYRAYRGYYSARRWSYYYATFQFVDVGFRPVLEVLNTDALGSDGLKAVTLDLNGGKLGGSTDNIQIIVKNGAAFTAPTSAGLTRPNGDTGDYFKWLGSDCKLYTPGDSVPADVTTLTALWTDTYTVTLNTNGGTIANGKDVTEYTYGTGATLPTADDITRDSHTFEGWYEDENFSGSPVTEISTTDTGKKEFYAKWTRNTTPITPGDTVRYIVEHYKANGSGYTLADTEYPAGKIGVIVTATPKTYDGFTYNAQISTASGTLKKISSADDIVTLKLYYDLTIYNVTVENDGHGTASASPASATMGEEITLTATPNNGYRFKEWQVVSGGVTISSDKFTMPTDNVTVKAIFERMSSGGSSTPSYSVTVPKTENGTITVSPKSASRGGTVTITVTPDDGYTLETLTATDSKGNEIELTDKGSGKYTFQMPASKVEITATFMEDNTMLNFFVDVFPGDYYYDAVLWAAKNGITGGVDDTHFAPNAPCTRAQIVTFLWRAAGSPAPLGIASSFTDVPADAYYAKAVQWAVEQGITVGTSATTFSPDATCTRAQSVTFLYRAAKAAAAGNNPFTDVADNAYYTDAVKWAVAEGVTAGTSATTFSPDQACTRAQIVTFIYRAET